MSALTARDQFHADITLFGDAHERDWPRQSRHFPADDRAALVDHHERPNAAHLERGRDRPRARAEGFFVLAKSDDDRSSRLETGSDQHLDRLELPNHAHLVVERTASP